MAKARGPPGNGDGEVRTALVCAGGGVTGAVYEIGALRALEELLDRSVLDFDIYVGVSGGAFVASLLASGISPRRCTRVVSARNAVRRIGPPVFSLGLPTCRSAPRAAGAHRTPCGRR